MKQIKTSITKIRIKKIKRAKKTNDKIKKILLSKKIIWFEEEIKIKTQREKEKISILKWSSTQIKLKLNLIKTNSTKREN